ncbi:MAG: hypothetical protein KAJ09_00065 [Deltaproteobacteria bacterium]|nr:hypothetical protein [Deltaproteobacteria bacterium]
MRDSTLAIQPQNLRQLLRQLIDIYSPSGKELGTLVFHQGYLERHGLPVARQRVNEARYNLMVVPPEADIDVALVAHPDTVAAAELIHFQQVCLAAEFYVDLLISLST